MFGNGDPDIHGSNCFIREDYTRITQQLQQQQQRIYHSPPPTPILDPTLPRPPRKPLPPVPSDEIDVCANVFISCVICMHAYVHDCMASFYTFYIGSWNDASFASRSPSL